MLNKRTKQQIANDGIQTAWHDDAFTEILHRQVKEPFSMDGIVPFKNTSAGINVKMGVKYKLQNIETKSAVSKAKKKVGKFVRNIDGIKMPWKQTCSG